MAGKAATLQGFINLRSSNFGIFIDNVKVPGFKDSTGNETTKNFKDIKSETIENILNGDHDPHADDESSLVNAGVKAMENTTAFLRLIEGRIKSYRVVIERCKSTSTELKGIYGRMDKRLKIIGDELAEARHDVSVSRALKAEELERIDGINARRQAIIEEHVTFSGIP